MKKLDKKSVFLLVTLVSIVLAVAWSEVFIADVGVVLAGLAVLILKEDKKPVEVTVSEPAVSEVIAPTVIEEAPVVVPKPVVEVAAEVPAPKKRGRKPKNAS